VFKDANQRLKELEQNADKLAKFSDSLVQRVNRVNAIRRSRFLPPVVRPMFSIGDGDKVTIAQVKEYAVNARVSANELKKKLFEIAQYVTRIDRILARPNSVDKPALALSLQRAKTEAMSELVLYTYA
jgi:hypothetical protein